MPTKKQRLLLGAHMSVAGGFEKAIERGESIDCTTIQIFTKSNRQWRAKNITQQEADVFIQAQRASATRPIIAHCTYLINIGSPNKETEKKSIDALAVELQRCEKLKVPSLVLHPGSHLKTGEEDCLLRIADNLNRIFSKDTGNTKILLETMAGQGSAVGYTFEQLATIYKHCTFKKRLGICFDTCHAFAAGYDFRTAATYKSIWQEFDDVIGLKKLKAIHVNDSKKGLGSRVDRHEHIGKGKIGLEAFRLLFNDKRFFDIPKILETPKDDLKEDARNMAVIKKMLSSSTKKTLGIK